MEKKDKEKLKRLGKKIKLARVKADFTQAKLADIVGVEQGYISSLERGGGNNNFVTLGDICKVLKIRDIFDA